MEPIRNGKCHRTGHIITAMALSMIFLMLSSTVSSTIEFTSPKDGDVVTQKAITITGKANAASSLYIEDDHASFDMGSKVNFTLLEDGYIILAPYIGTWTKGASNPVIGVGGAGDFNQLSSSSSSVMLDGNTYKIWGSGLDALSVRSLGLWTSANGVTWTPSGSNPILEISGGSGFDSSVIRSPWVIKDGATYKMWYSGKGPDNRWRIGYATSADGVSWTRGNGGQPVLDLGNIAKFDGGGVAHPSVIKDGATFKMWYAGVIEGTSLWQIGYATSADGIDWTRQNNSNPVVGFGKKGSFDEDGCTYPRVIKDGNAYRMWYMGRTKKVIAYATSVNGVLWKKDPENPLMSPGGAGSFDETSIGNMAIMIDGFKFKMWYSGNALGTTTIGYADAPINGLNGVYTSKPFNADNTVDWGRATWSWDIPQGTSGKVETRTSADQSTWESWVEVANNTETTSAANKFFQYKVTMDTTDSNIIPEFYNFCIEYMRVVKVEVSLDNSSWFIANGTDDWDIEMSLIEGNNTIYVKVTDTTPYPQYENIVVRVDTTVPSGHIEIDDGETFTTSRTVMLTLDAQDLMGVDKMRISNSDDLSEVAWEDFAANSVWELEAVDGVKTVYVEFQDTNGLMSRSYSDTIILDTIPPVSTILVNENATYTAVTEVQLSLKSTDKNGIKQMRVSTNEDFEGADWDTYLTTLSVMISEGDGEKTVHAEFMDMAGLTTVVSDSIFLDSVKPTGSIEINNGTDLTRNRNVYLSIYANDGNGIRDMMISNYPDFVDGVWEPLVYEKMWDLPNAIGNNKVYARFRDNAGLVSEAYSDSIFLHTKVIIGSIEINGGEDLTDDPLVDLDITLREYDGLTKMMLSNSPDFAGASFQEYKPKVEWNLSASTDGEHTVYLRFEDQYEIGSDVFSDSILIDTTAPVISIISPETGDKFKNGSLVVKGSSYDKVGLSRVEVSIDGGPWVQMQTMDNWTYTTTFALRGDHTIRARATDLVGNTDETSVTVKYPKKDTQNQPGFEGLLLLGAIAMMVMARRLRSRSGKRD